MLVAKIHSISLKGAHGSDMCSKKSTCKLVTNSMQKPNKVYYYSLKCMQTVIKKSYKFYI